MRHIITFIGCIAFTLVASGAACPTSPTNFCEQQLQAQCEFQFRCCKDKERIQTFGRQVPYVTSEGECVDRVKSICKATNGSLEDSISLGRLKFNGDKAAECITAAQAARDSCVASDAFSPSCDLTTSGLVKDGDACGLDAECGEGGHCKIDNENPDVNADEGAIEGECVAPGEKGDDCGEALCQRGLVCRIGTGGQGTCDDAPEKGDDCVSGQCGAGLFCDTDNTCAELRDDGDDCDVPSQCKTQQCTDNECGSGICDGK